MASISSNSPLNEPPIPVAITTNRLNQLPSRFPQKFLTGKVIRLQAHVYVFICSHCDAEFRSPNSFLQHCELHYLPTPMTMPYYPSNYPSSSFPEQISPASSNRISTGFASAAMPTFSSLPPYNSLPYTQQSRHWPTYNSMAYSDQRSIAPRQANGSSYSDSCSPIGGAQAQSSSLSTMQNIGGIDHQQQMQSTQGQSKAVERGTDSNAAPDDDIYEIYDLGYDLSSTVPDSGEPTKKSKSKSKTGPYKCEFCSKAYNRLSSLARHYHNTHKPTSEESRPNSTA